MKRSWFRAVAITTGSSADVGRVHARRKTFVYARASARSSCAVARPTAVRAWRKRWVAPAGAIASLGSCARSGSSLDKVPSIGRAPPTALTAVPARLIASNILSFAVPITSGSLTLLASSPGKAGFTSLRSWTAALAALWAGPCTRSSMLDLLSPLCAWRSSNAAPHDDLSSFTPIAARNLPAPLIGSSSLNMAWSLP